MTTLNTTGLVDAKSALENLTFNLERGLVSQAEMSSLESAVPNTIDKNYPIQTFSKGLSTQNITAAKKAQVDATFSIEMASGAEEISVMLGYMTVLNNQRIQQRLKQLHTAIDEGLDFVLPVIDLTSDHPSDKTIDIRQVLES